MSTSPQQNDIQYRLRDDGFLFSEAYLTGGNREIAEEYHWPVPVFERHREDTATSIGYSDEEIRPGDILEYCGGSYEEFLLVVAILPVPAQYSDRLEIRESDRLLCYSSNAESYRLFHGNAFIDRGEGRLDHRTGEYALHKNAAPLVTTSPNQPADVTHPPMPRTGSEQDPPSETVQRKYPLEYPPNPSLSPKSAVTENPQPVDSLTNSIQQGDAYETLATVPTNACHGWVSSPPYYNVRNYNVEGQIGREPIVKEYLENILSVVNQLMRVTRDDGLGALIVDDTYDDGSLLGIPQRLHQEIVEQGYEIVHHAPWTKPNPKPDPAKSRYTHSHEHILIISHGGSDHYFNKQAADDPRDVFEIDVGTTDTDHDAVFPLELPKQLIRTMIPEKVCPECGAPHKEVYEVTDIRDLDTNRPQAKRALELADRHNLTDEQLRAVRAVGLGHTGQAQRTQTGTGNNRSEVEKLAAEAEDALGSYTREFTNPRKHRTGFTPSCNCDIENGTNAVSGIVIDPFMGSGSTGLAAKQLRRRWIGIELNDDYIATAQSRIGIDVDDPDRLIDDAQNTLSSFGA